MLSCVTDFQGLLDKLVEEMMGIKSRRSDASRPHDPSKGEGQEIKAG